MHNRKDSTSAAPSARSSRSTAPTPGCCLPVAFWLFLVVAILNGIAGSSLLLLLLASVVGIAAGTLYQGMVVNLVRDVQDGRRDSSAGELLELRPRPSSCP